TTLLFLLIDFLLKIKTEKKYICYINLETIQDYKIFSNPQLFIENIRAGCNPKKKIFVFIDEIQRIQNSGMFLKGLFDLQPNIKLFVSGSSSLEIQSKTKEFLTGRKKETVLLPLTFNEIVDYNQKLPAMKYISLAHKNINRWRELDKIYSALLIKQIEKSALFGHYPAILKKSGNTDKIETLNELFNSYVKKDVVDFIKIEKTDLFNQLVKVLSGQIGNLINKSEIGSHIQINSATLNHYLSVLQDTFVTHYLPPYTSLRRNEVKSAHKCFFFDNGLRNFALRMFSELEFRPDKGMLLENLVFTEIYKKLSVEQELFFWRTKAGAEVDFVLTFGNNIIPIEVKSGSVKSGMISKSFHSFIDNFKPVAGICLNKDTFDIANISGSRIYYIPIHWFLIYFREIIQDILK
nr:ATP-binding protein [Candidatus Dependentiae bacterium]